ncbi:MAG: hypothetical protein QOI31_1597 [Solirubrobacterales bacterium]|jgi:hypothetical protein|nr:hypothetical protein [Solirubrobacterales bacterium]
MGKHAFFELSASLIPVLLLGGVLARNLSPPDAATELRPAHSIAQVAIVLALTFVVLAEVVAIAAVMSGANDDGSFGIVAIAVLLGLVGTATAIGGPWVRRVNEGQPMGLPTILATVTVVVVVLGWVSFGTLRDGFESAGSVESDSAIVESLRRVNDAEADLAQAEIEAERDGRVDAREDLLLSLLRDQREFELDELTHTTDSAER